jgi:hypothetical protein
MSTKTCICEVASLVVAVIFMHGRSNSDPESRKLPPKAFGLPKSYKKSKKDPRRHRGLFMNTLKASLAS